MLKKFALILFVTIFTGCSMRPGYYAEDLQIQKMAEPAEAKTSEAETVPQTALVPLGSDVSPGLRQLPVGEKLVFSIRWLGLEAGRTTVTIKEIVKINGRDCYHIQAFTRTTYILDLLFRIRDYHDTYVDTEGFYSHRFVKRASEGELSYDETNDFDYVQNKAFYTNKRKNESKVTDLPGKVQDIVSVSYWFRSQDVKVGDSVKAYLHSDEKNYDVTISVLNKEEFKADGKDQVPVMVIEPKLQRGNKPYKKGRGKIWVTDDAERLPLFAEAHVIIAGTLNIVLLSKENIYANK